MTIDFQEHAGAGLEDISMRDINLNSWYIVQPLSPILGLEEVPKGVELGVIYDPVSKHATKKLQIISCDYKRVFVEWAKRDVSTSPVAIHQPDNRPYAEWNDDEGKLVTQKGTFLYETGVHCVLAKELKHWVPGVIWMARSYFKASKELNQLIMSKKGYNKQNQEFQYPRFSHIYTLGTQRVTKGKHFWYTWQILDDELIGVDLKPIYLQALNFHRSKPFESVFENTSSENNEQAINAEKVIKLPPKSEKKRAKSKASRAIPQDAVEPPSSEEIPESYPEDVTPDDIPF